MNTKKTLIATCVVGGLFGLGLFIHYCYQQNKPEAKSDKGDTPERPSAGAPKDVQEIETKTTPLISKTKSKTAARELSQAPSCDEFPLRLGSRGKRVERLRIWLMRNYGWTGIITDQFDKQTEKSLKRYLKKSQVDEITYNKLRMGKDFYGQS